MFGLREPEPNNAAGGSTSPRALANYAQVFANPRAKICYRRGLRRRRRSLRPVSLRRALAGAAGETRASIAGFVVAGFAVGGMIYSLSVGRLVANFGQRRVMIVGGCSRPSASLVEAALPPWPVQFAALTA